MYFGLEMGTLITLILFAILFVINILAYMVCVADMEQFELAGRVQPRWFIILTVLGGVFGIAYARSRLGYELGERRTRIWVGTILATQIAIIFIVTTPAKETAGEVLGFLASEAKAAVAAQFGNDGPSYFGPKR
ncbi:MAG: hypothetical protein HUJ27_11785 [Rhodobacteraceae bacterium]|nr:hypothetical protein [Paracoccaceae bacterium]